MKKIALLCRASFTHDDAVRILPLLLCILLTACNADTVRRPGAALPSSSASSSFAAIQLSELQPLEQLPSELSIRHFGSMRLTGTGLTLGQIEADNNAYTRYAVTYESNGLLISGILNIPKGDGPFPLLIFNHGYIDPAVYTRGRGLKREQDFMARRGFAVLHTDYRGHAESDKSPMDEEGKIYDGGLEYAMDSVNAIHAVRSANLPQIDDTRVGMLGHSMGGGVTLSIITAYPELIDAAVLYAPVHADMWENFYRWRRERDEGDRTLEVFGERDENPGPWDAISPLTYLQDIRTPVLLFQGTKDKDVPAEWSDDLAERMTALDKDVTYVSFEGEGHEFGTRWTDFMEKSAALFDEHLRENAAN